MVATSPSLGNDGKEEFEKTIYRPFQKELNFGKFYR